MTVKLLFSDALSTLCSEYSSTSSLIYTPIKYHDDRTSAFSTLTKLKTIKLSRINARFSLYILRTSEICHIVNQLLADTRI